MVTCNFAADLHADPERPHQPHEPLSGRFTNLISIRTIAPFPCILCSVREIFSACLSIVVQFPALALEDIFRKAVSAP